MKEVKQARPQSSNGNGNGNGARPEKQVASELRDHPEMEKLMFGQVLKPYLEKLEALGTPPEDVNRIYLQSAINFLSSSSTSRALQTRKLERLYVDSKLSRIITPARKEIALEANIEYDL